MMRPLFIALQFLTRLPVPLRDRPTENDTGRSLLYYPLVGLVLGLLLTATAWALADAPAGLRAALVLAVWVLLTGALHLDGLADSADAWMGGRGDRERTLAIMRDPCSGPGGVVALVVVLIVKFAALESILATGDWMPLVLAPLLARALLPLLFLTTPYVRPGGLGAAMAQHLPRRTAAGVVLATALAVPAFTGAQGVWSLAAAAAVFILLRAMMQRRLQGTTGDAAGAMVELIETATLVAAAIV